MIIARVLAFILGIAVVAVTLISVTRVLLVPRSTPDPLVRVVFLVLRFLFRPWAHDRIHGLENLSKVWPTWEAWFAEIEESHTSLPALVFFRSPQPDRSWVTAAGAVLDAAALTASTLDVPRDASADLCIRAGFIALRRVADYFHFPYNPDPHYPHDPISVTRLEFDAVYDRLANQGIPLRPDHDQAWRDFAGWRVNYDAVLLALADLTMAPRASWSSDRSQGRGNVKLKTSSR